jgi:hypothetical protein
MKRGPTYNLKRGQGDAKRRYRSDACRLVKRGMKAVTAAARSDRLMRMRLEKHKREARERRKM